MWGRSCKFTRAGPACGSRGRVTRAGHAGGRTLAAATGSKWLRGGREQTAAWRWWAGLRRSSSGCCSGSDRKQAPRPVGGGLCRSRRSGPDPGPPSGRCTSSLLACLVGPAAPPRRRRRPDSVTAGLAVVLTGSFEPGRFWSRPGRQGRTSQLTGKFPVLSNLNRSFRVDCDITRPAQWAHQACGELDGLNADGTDKSPHLAAKASP